MNTYIHRIADKTKAAAKLFAAATIIACFSLFSCSGWLDITPEDTVAADELFSTAAGYHTALNGIYQELASGSLYGRELTWGFAGALSQYYACNNEPNVEKRYSRTEKYDYNTNEVEGYTSAVWLAAYNAIANANNLLQHLDAADANMFPDVAVREPELIRGEALALRAMLHFDLLRLFAPAPAAGGDAPGIPYNDKFPNTFAKRLSVDTTLKRIVADLREACRLLDLYEGSEAFRNRYLMSANVRYSQNMDGVTPFFLGRGTRLNHVAARALLASVSLYAGDLTAAGETAQLILDDCVAPLSNAVALQGFSFMIASNPSWNTSDAKLYPRKMMSELCFGLYNSALASDYESLTAAAASNNAFALKNVEGTYDNDLSDRRYGKLIYEENPGATGGNLIRRTLKYTVTANAKDVENSLVPMIRIPEVKFIQMECLSAVDLPQAVAELNDYRRNVRGCTADITATAREEFLKELSREIKKEFACEGAHYFFFCKRHRLPVSDGVSDIDMTDKYVLPFPQNEITL
jgi:hypothetical protein